MIFHANTTMDDFERWLQITAREGGMPSQFIDLVDSLDAAGQAKELEAMREELDDAKSDRDNLYSELQDLVNALDEDDDLSDRTASALRTAQKALERHG